MNLSQAIATRYDQLHTTRVRRLFGFIIIALAVTFVLALHPISGVLGGMFIVFLGWSVPSVLNISASALVLAYLPRELGRYPIAVLVTGIIASLLLAVIPEAPQILQRFVNPPLITTNIRRVITVPLRYPGLPGPPISPKLDVEANPLAQTIRMGFNEGCGCSYWLLVDSDPSIVPSSYLDLLSWDLNRRDGSGGLMWRVDDPIQISVVEVTNRSDPNRADITIDIKDSGVVTAEFHEFSVPRYPRAFINADGLPLSSGPFGAITWNDLTRGTFWSPIVGAQVGYYPRAQIRRFLQDAITIL